MPVLSLFKSELREMTENESEAFLQACLAPEVALTEMTAEKSGPLPRILYNRLCKANGCPITSNLAYLLSVLSGGNPGNLVMLAYSAFKAAEAEKKASNEPVTIGDFMFAFEGTGVPTERAYSKVWDSQKATDGRNLLDTTSWKDL